MDEGQPLFAGKAVGIIGRLLQCIAMQDDLGPEILGVLDLGERGLTGHDDGHGNRQALAVISDPLGVIARRHGNDAGFALGFVQGHQTVERAAFLEGSGELQIFELHRDIGPGQLRQGARALARRGLDGPGEMARGCLDVRKGQQGSLLLNGF